MLVFHGDELVLQLTAYLWTFEGGGSVKSQELILGRDKNISSEREN